MTTEYIFKNTVEELAKEFPELSAYLPSDRAIVDHFEVPSEKSMMKMIVRMSDRVNVHWEVNGCRLSGVWGFFIGEVIEEIREYLSERKVFLEYEVDLDLARKLNQEIPEGVPTKTMCRSSPYNSIPTQNDEYYYSNRIKVSSWNGTYNVSFEAPYIRA